MQSGSPRPHPARQHGACPSALPEAAPSNAGEGSGAQSTRALPCAGWPASNYKPGGDFLVEEASIGRRKTDAATAFQLVD